MYIVKINKKTYILKGHIITNSLYEAVKYGATWNIEEANQQAERFGGKVCEVIAQETPIIKPIKKGKKASK